MRSEQDRREEDEDIGASRLPAPSVAPSVSVMPQGLSSWRYDAGRWSFADGPSRNAGPISNLALIVAVENKSGLCRPCAGAGRSGFEAGHVRRRKRRMNSAAATVINLV